MIRSIFNYLFRNKRFNIFEKYEKELHEEYAIREETLQNKYRDIEERTKEEIRLKLLKLDQDKKEVEDLEKRVLDRRDELARVNHELKERLRIIEAKARPDQVWVSAFGSGFNKAFEQMQPLIDEAIKKSQRSIQDKAIEESINRIDDVVLDSIDKLKLHHLRPVQEIEMKKTILLDKLGNSKEEDRLRRQHYIEAIEWMMNGHDKKD